MELYLPMPVSHPVLARRFSGVAALVLAAAVLGVAGAGLPATAGAATCKGADARPARAADLPAAQKATLCLVNRERTTRGRRALKNNGLLKQVEAALARDMVKRDYFNHTTPGGRTFSDRLKAEGWRGSTAGENIAWGSGELGSPAQIVDGWMHSAGHRANILNPSFTRAGTSVILGAPEPGIADAATYAMAYDRP